MNDNNKQTVNITFLPEDLTVEVPKEMTILDAADEYAIDLNHNCGGVCACSTCHVIVIKGMENLSEIAEEEEEQLDEAEGLTLESRLGCQAIILGDVTVEIPG